MRGVSEAVEAERTIIVHLVGIADVSKGATTRSFVGPSGAGKPSITSAAYMRVRTRLPEPKAQCGGTEMALKGFWRDILIALVGGLCKPERPHPPDYLARLANRVLNDHNLCRAPLETMDECAYNHVCRRVRSKVCALERTGNGRRRRVAHCCGTKYSSS